MEVRRESILLEEKREVGGKRSLQAKMTTEMQDSSTGVVFFCLFVCLFFTDKLIPSLKSVAAYSIVYTKFLDKHLYWTVDFQAFYLSQALIESAFP